jgi:hypothetical protein
MVMNPVGFGTNNHCAGEGQQQFSSRSDNEVSDSTVSWSRRLAVLSCSVTSRYLATTSEQTEDFTCTVVVVIIECVNR